MTFTVILHDPATGTFGAGIASKYPAVGGVCLHGHFRGGIVSTQSMASPYLGQQTLARLRDGKEPRAALEAALAGDPNRAVRQTLAMDVSGRCWAETGADCVDWNGIILRDGLAIAGNMLAGPHVLAAMEEAAMADPSAPLSARLVKTLRAAENAGGDKRGRQAAAIAIYRPWTCHPHTIRVEDHPDPLNELERLHALFHDGGIWADFDATLADESGEAIIHPHIEI